MICVGWARAEGCVHVELGNRLTVMDDSVCVGWMSVHTCMYYPCQDMLIFSSFLFLHVSFLIHQFCFMYA